MYELGRATLTTLGSRAGTLSGCVSSPLRRFFSEFS